MNEADRYKAAWRARRQRLGIFFVLAFALLGGLHETDSPLVGAACLAGIVALIWWLYRFRCPRCGEIFLRQWYKFTCRTREGPLRCEHCGLALNEIPGEKQA